jgi:hypothetical protein
MKENSKQWVLNFWEVLRGKQGGIALEIKLLKELEFKIS